MSNAAPQTDAGTAAGTGPSLYSAEVIELPRGGFIVDSPIGYIQFGSPPETVKDTMGLPRGVPQLFVLPSRFFNWIKGISVAEVEFPIYYNFFLKKRKTYIVCHKEQQERFVTVLQQALFGPEHLRIAVDFPEGTESNTIPAVEKEFAHFRGNMKLSDLVGFVLFRDDRVEIKGVEIRIEREAQEGFVVSSAGGELAKIPAVIEYVPKYDIGERLHEPYDPPVFGVTCLGPSHGFDPTENTSGFILWLNRKGIMIDPPVNTTEWLLDSNVSPKLIDSIILTHCHADHDAGTLQKILEEGKIRVFSTRTVIDSFLRKYAALTDVSIDYLQQLFDFHPIHIGRPVFIHGGKFLFHYSLHSIPTIGFRLEYGGKSFVYSSDHNADPDLHDRLLEEGTISKRRREEFASFPWDSDIIYHESGIPPLHTPIAFLDSMDDEVKKRTMVYHIAKKDFPEETSLTLCRFGIEHTLTFDVPPSSYEHAYHVLGLLSYLNFFQDMPIDKAQEFLSIVETEQFAKDSTIITRGTVGDTFYIIKSGNVYVRGDDPTQRKIYGVYDYFGEVALLTGQQRTADVIAETDVTAYSIEKDKFLHFLEGTEWKRVLRRLAKVRDAETWRVLSESPFFNILTSTQKTHLESFLHPLELDRAGIIVTRGQPLERVYIIRSGNVAVLDATERHIATLHDGELIGAMVKIHRGEPAEHTFKSEGPVSLYYINKEDVLAFLNNNPGMIMKLTYEFLRR